MEVPRQVLLLGNGLNRAFGGDSWSNLLETISQRSDFNIGSLTSPMPLQAVLLTNNHLKEAMRNQQKAFWGELKTVEQHHALQSILEIGFDDILTTNYSYELESAANDAKSISPYQLKKMIHRSKEKREVRYLLHTYNETQQNGRSTHVWHIHGESRLPDSMILGHYWYGNMLSKIKEYLTVCENRYQKTQQDGAKITYDSWVDSFILGDVYILGFGFDLSEFDLWWLLNRRMREKAITGTVYFYEYEQTPNREKIELLKLMGVQVVNIDLPDDADYKKFYLQAIEDIRQHVLLEREVNHGQICY